MPKFQHLHLLFLYHLRSPSLTRYFGILPVPPYRWHSLVFRGLFLEEDFFWSLNIFTNLIKVLLSEVFGGVIGSSFSSPSSPRGKHKKYGYLTEPEDCLRGCQLQ